MAKKKVLTAPQPIRSDNSADLVDIYTDKPVSPVTPSERRALGDPLDEEERQTFVTCKLTIEKGIQTFLDVGNALKIIREQKLYRETHATFESFMQDEFGLPRRRAYQLMEAAEVIEQIKRIELPVSPAESGEESAEANGAAAPTESEPPAIDLNESQARAMFGLSDSELGDVWPQVQQIRGDTKKRVPARKIREMVDEVREKPARASAGKKKPKADQADQADQPDAEWLTPVVSKMNEEVSASGESTVEPVATEKSSDRATGNGDEDREEIVPSATLTKTQELDQATPVDESRRQIKQAVSRASGQDISVTVYGTWLIREGIAGDWHQLRGRDPASEDAITAEYRDVLFAEEARQLGLL